MEAHHAHFRLGCLLVATNMQPRLSSIYQSILNTWASALKSKRTGPRMQWVSRHHSHIAERISCYVNVNTRKLHYQALAAVFRHLQQPQLTKKYSSEASKLHKQSMQAESRQTLSPSERRKWLPLSLVTAKAKELARYVQCHPLDIKANLQHLVLAMYTLQPPLRREYCNMPVVQKAPRAPDTNYVLRAAPGAYTVVLNKDKVSRRAGPGRFKLSKALGSVIESSLKRYPRAYLFSLQHSPDKPMGGQCFDKLLAGIWPERRVTVNVLRSAYVTAFYDKHHDIAARDKLAALMRHSRSTAELSYYKRQHVAARS